MRIQTRRLSCNSIEELEQNKVWGNQNRRINIRTRGHSRLCIRKLWASQSLEEVERWWEKGGMYKRLSIWHQTPEKAARQREQNIIYFCKNFKVLSHVKKLKGNGKRAECARDCLASKSRRSFKTRAENRLHAKVLSITDTEEIYRWKERSWL